MLRLALLLCAVGASLAGCLACQPHLDVRHCLPGQDGCGAPAGGVVAWNATLAAEWPDVDRLLRSTDPGRHRHASWDAGREAAWWQAMGVPADRDGKEVFVALGGDTFRVRVLSCGG